MALILTFVNKSHLADISDYEVEVLIGDGTRSRSQTIAKGEVKGHRRADGWEALVLDFVMQARKKKLLDELTQDAQDMGGI